MLRAISCIPGEYLPPAQGRIASEALARSATLQAYFEARDVEPGADVHVADRQQGAGNEAAVRHLMDALGARRDAHHAAVQLQTLLVPGLNRWRRQVRRRKEVFLETEDELDGAQLEAAYRPLTAFAEAVRALDACFMVLAGRVNVPYR